MHPKLIIGCTGYGKGTIAIPFSEAINTFRQKNDPNIVLHAFIRYKRANYTNTRYTKRSIRRLHVIRGTQYTTDNTLVRMQKQVDNRENEN